jgi:hypothetical protein
VQQQRKGTATITQQQQKVAGSLSSLFHFAFLLKLKCGLNNSFPIAALQQLQHVAKAGGGTTPLLIPPQQQAGLHKVMVQQVMVKQPVSGGAAQNTIQQIVSTPLQTTAGSVMTTHVVTQRPAVTLTTAIAQQAARGNAVVSSTGTSLVANSVALTQGATLVKQVQELVASSPQHKATTLSPQVKTVQQMTTVRQLPNAQSVQVLQQPSQVQPQVVKQMATPTTSNVQQAVQQVLQQAHNQTVQPQQTRPVVVSNATTTLSQQASTQPQQQQQQATAVSVTAPVTISAAQQQQLIAGSAQQQAQAQGGDKSPYAMRLRNQRS